MDIKVLSSTKPGYVLSTNEALKFGGMAAGICYMPDSFETILNESEELTKKRMNQTLCSGHHSVFDHCSYGILLEGIPKILAMIINNEKEYSTSEKSARYTQMKPSPEEQILYDKWLLIFADCIKRRYPDLTEVAVKKLAQENARYLISVFTPTTMLYTTTIRQLNYIMYWFEKFIAADRCGAFQDMIKPYMVEFLEMTKPLCVAELNDEAKGRELSLFSNKECGFEEYFGEVYSTSYLGSFAQLAQAQRHRTIDYRMSFPFDTQYYIPPIISDDNELVEDWLRDMGKVAPFYPQGTMVQICERGTYEKFILKTKERLCSSAQLEVSRQTYETLQKYLKGTADYLVSKAVYRSLKQCDSQSRCGAGYKCLNPCKWGKNQLDRLI